jgi:hypothetical protein
MGRTPYIVSLVLTIYLTLAPPAISQGSNAAECEWLLGHVGHSQTLVLAGRSLLLDSTTSAKIKDLQSQLAALTRHGIVVYAPVISSGHLVMLRFETEIQPQPARVEVRETKWNSLTFRTALIAAQQPGGDFFRRDLQRQMIPEQPGLDDGKTVFFFDPEGYGLVPQAFKLQKSFILASPRIRDAVENLQLLQTQRRPPSEYVAVLGLPSTEVEFRKVFGDTTKFGELPEWRKHALDAAKVASENRVRVLAGPGEKGANNKEQLLSALEKQSGIIFLVAHADGAHILLPGSTETVDITPSDIAARRFNSKSFVVLRVCQGEDQGFANAFIKAGAGAVSLAN